MRHVAVIELVVLLYSLDWVSIRDTCTSCSTTFIIHLATRVFDFLRFICVKFMLVATTDWHKTVFLHSQWHSQFLFLFRQLHSQFLFLFRLRSGSSCWATLESCWATLEYPVSFTQIFEFCSMHEIFFWRSSSAEDLEIGDHTIY